MIRQPIVSVLGHIDHGKTQLLDSIRGSTVIEREAGRITQHIGATEVPIDVIYRICGSLLGRKRFTFPGLLFIDTPGHQAFTTLRARGGALSDLAVLVVDINEGFKPQTVESLNILKRYKTPFVVAANKIDLINGWVSEKKPFAESYKKQVERAMDVVDEKIYEIVGKIYNYGFSSERYDRITDFTKNIAIVPISAKTGEGIQDLLMMLVGLAQRFLEKQLKTEEGPGEGTVLEVKENAVNTSRMLSSTRCAILGLSWKLTTPPPEVSRRLKKMGRKT
ncbi:MAG: GTP-binding protein [Candidatus Thermoplasmatota archaeon]|nr:GTP-binding protein [Candidatus Thermoplasmatota archaeon]